MDKTLDEKDLEYSAYVLDEAYERLKDVYLSSSVLGPVRLYVAKDEVDREFWTFFCALLDFQTSVQKVLNPMLIGLAKYLEENGLKFIDLIYDKNLAHEVFKKFKWISRGEIKQGFTHRFAKINDLLSLLKIFKEIIIRYSSIKALVKSAYNEAINKTEPMEYVLKILVKSLNELLSKCNCKSLLIPIKFGSALKRFNLFMRWMVRPYPDLGLWSFIDKRYLLVSLDESLRRVLLRAFSIDVKVNWHGVLKVTKFFRKLKPEDPVKYDYLLSRLPIMGYCAKNHVRSKCYLCPIANVCISSHKITMPVSKSLTRKEQLIFNEFLKTYGNEIDKFTTEYPLDNYSADAVIHLRNCNEYVVEVEQELNYIAIGQVITYRYLYFRKYEKYAKPMIICTKAPRELKETCEIEQGIKVVEVKVY